MNELLLRAIREKRIIAFAYKRGARRTAEPHDYGVIGGEPRLLAYQLSGASTSGSPRGWKNLFVHDMRGLTLLDEHFPGSRGHEAKTHLAWDILFARVE